MRRQAARLPDTGSAWASISPHGRLVALGASLVADAFGRVTPPAASPTPTSAPPPLPPAPASAPSVPTPAPPQ